MNDNNKIKITNMPYFSFKKSKKKLNDESKQQKVIPSDPKEKNKIRQNQKTSKNLDILNIKHREESANKIKKCMKKNLFLLL